MPTEQRIRREYLRQRRYATLIALLLICVFVLAPIWAVPRIEQTLQTHSEMALNRAGVDGDTVRVSFSGRDATVTGHQQQAEEIAQAEELIGRIPGVRAVHKGILPEDGTAVSLDDSFPQSLVPAIRDKSEPARFAEAPTSSRDLGRVSPAPDAFVDTETLPPAEPQAPAPDEVQGMESTVAAPAPAAFAEPPDQGVLQPAKPQAVEAYEAQTAGSTLPPPDSSSPDSAGYPESGAAKPFIAEGYTFRPAAPAEEAGPDAETEVIPAQQPTELPTYAPVDEPSPPAAFVPPQRTSEANPPATAGTDPATPQAAPVASGGDPETTAEEPPKAEATTASPGQILRYLNQLMAAAPGFIGGGARLHPQTQRALAQAAEVLKQVPDLHLAVVAYEGHYRASPWGRHRVSQHRTSVVYRILLGQGAPADRLMPLGANPPSSRSHGPRLGPSAPSQIEFISVTGY